MLQLHFLTLIASRRFYTLNLSHLNIFCNFCTNLSHPKLNVPIYFKADTWKSSNFHVPYNQFYLPKNNYLTKFTQIVALYGLACDIQYILNQKSTKILQTEKSAKTQLSQHKLAHFFKLKAGETIWCWFFFSLLP